MSIPRPPDILDAALLADAPGQGNLFTFETVEERERFRWRLTAAMSNAAQKSKRDLFPEHPMWGHHPWQTVAIFRVGEHQLWVGLKRKGDAKPGVQIGVSLDDVLGKQ